MKTYTISEIRKLAGTKDVYKTKRGFVYKLVNGKKEYVRKEAKNERDSQF